LIEVGADWLSLKDATGIMTPFDCYRIVKGIKDRAKGKLPVLLHCHDMGGTSSMSHLMAILAGVDMIDTVLSPLSFGSAHPATETMVASLKGTPFDTESTSKLWRSRHASLVRLRKNMRSTKPATLASAPMFSYTKYP